MSSSYVWVQLYYEDKDKGKVEQGSPIKIKPIPEDVADLIKATKTELKPKIDYAPLDEIFVYRPDTDSERTSIRGDKVLQELIDELGNKNPPVTIDYDHPLIVVAPGPQQQPANGEDQTPLKTSILADGVKAPAPFGEDHYWKELVNKKDFRKLRDADNQVANGWRREQDTTTFLTLFLRQELTVAKRKVDNFLSDTQTVVDRLYVNGAPGSGKTTFFLWHACQSWTHKKPRVLVVQYRASGTNEIMIVDHLSENIKSFQLPGKGGVDADSLYGILEKLLVSDFLKDLEYFIFDGVRQKRCENVLSLLNTRFRGTNHKKGIHVTSLQFNITGGDGSDKTDQYMTIYSWNLQDYKDAVDAMKLTTEEMKELFNGHADLVAGDHADEDPSTHDLIERKYYYAGGSARLMFDRTIVKLTSETLPKALNRMESGFWTQYAQLKITEGTESAVNTLMQVIPSPTDPTGQAFPVSKYVLNQAYKECGDELVKNVKAAAEMTNNPALKGWAFELDQIDVVEKAMEQGRIVTNSGGEKATVPSATLSFDGISLSGLVPANTDIVIRCAKWNQGCFDIAFYQNGVLVTMQFTVSEKHSMKIEYIRHLIKALEEKGANVLTLTVTHHIFVFEKEQEPSTFQFTYEGEGYADGEPNLSIKIGKSKKLSVADDDGAAGAIATLGLTPETVKCYGNRRSKRLRTES